MTTATETPLAPFTRRKYVALTTFKRDGSGVATPVSVAVEGDRAYVRTYDKAWKVRRMRNNPQVVIAPSTVRGKLRGEPVRARARLLDGAEDQHARRLLARRQPVLHGLFVPAVHKLMGYRTLHYELTPHE